MQAIRSQTTPDGIRILTFDRPASPVNIFDRATLEELDAVIRDLGPETKGLVFQSAKPAVFLAGADLRSMRKMTTDEAVAFVQLGQDVFNRIAALPFPTVAAIHGAAVGGGYEIALACDWRVASPDRCTKIGLPETKLGLVPAWGGSTRLPRLIGVPKALDVILNGRTLPARHALKLGMVDEVAPREHLLAAADKWLRHGKRPRKLIHSAAVNTVVDTIIAPRARRDVAAKTHGHYPAVQKALAVVMAGAGKWDEAESLRLEREAIVELLASDTTRNLVNLFFLEEKAKHRAVPGVEKPPSIRRAAVIGAGTMGAGIAQWLSARGLRVILRDVDPARVAAGMATAAGLYAAGVKRHLFSEHEARSGLGLISPTATEVPLGQVDLVIEAAVEKMEVKKTIFRRLEELTREDALLATNTSALSVSELAAATKHPARVVGIHFFNPVHRMQLVEVIEGRQTAPEVTARAVNFVQKIGKLPVVVKDSPGFLVNRILMPGLIEAARLFEQGASVEDIDAAMIEFGMPMGPLRLVDEVGADIAADVATTLSAAFPDHLQTPEILSKLITKGWLGRKSGTGFYTHPKKGDPIPNPAADSLRPTSEPSSLSRDEIGRRMVLLMINEAARCLEEKNVNEAGDVDFAMVMGTGFAPFRGGPLRYADHIGPVQLVSELTRLAEDAGPRFRPCERLKEMAANGKHFYED